MDITSHLHTTRRAALLGAAALAALACSRELEPDLSLRKDPAASRVVHFHAQPVDTRAEFGSPDANGTRPTLWTDNDSEVKLSLNYGTAQVATVIPSQDYTNASFDADISFPTASPYTFYAVSPASAASALSPSREAWKVTIPCEQTPTESSVDENAIIIAATSNPYNSALEVENVDLFFNHLTAYGRMSLTGLPTGATVSAVELTTTTPIVGDWYWNTSGTAIEDYGASSTLTITTNRTSDIWFACAPVSVDNQMMTVTVTTNQGTYYKEVSFPGGASFEAGKAAVFTVDMSDATKAGGFTLVTDASQLQEGDDILIVYRSGSKALGNYNNGGYRNSESVSIENNNTITSSGNATVLKLCAGTTEGTWAFKDGNNYLASRDGSGGYIYYALLNSSTLTNNASWTVSVDNGLATIQALAGGCTYLSLYSTSNLFLCTYYASESNYQKVSLYRRGGSGSAALVDMENSAYGCYLGDNLTRTVTAGVDQVTRSYNNGVLTYTIVNPDTLEELEITGYTKAKLKGDAVTINVSWHRDVELVLNATYTMTVLKEEGAKVWIGDGSGKGFIIKK